MKTLDIEKYISRTLSGGVVASSFFIITGIILLFMHLPSTMSNHIPSFTEEIILFRSNNPIQILLHPYLYLYCGIFVIMITPIVRVMISILSFVIEKDWRFVCISSFVLIVITISISFSLFL